MTSLIIIDVQNPSDQFPEEDFDDCRDVITAVVSSIKKSKMQAIPNIAVLDSENSIHTNFKIDLDSSEEATSQFSKIVMNE